ncbi:restriction endonuclease subunit S [Vibrio parahaemolyticus]|nr:restriction endonuclease subunit S [Vibrio parahaemolyticus]HCG6692072.1 restriction endonuclease subunit S [Vibrio parahaemolyticus]
MAGRYKAYLEYKQPDIKFVNDIPTHWVISKVRHISTFGRGLPITKANLQDTGIPCVSYGEVHSKFGFEVDPSKHALKCVSEEYLASSPYALLSKGDFVFADTSEDIDGSGNFTQLVSDDTLFAGYHTVIVRPSPANYYRFVAYLFDSPEFRTQVRDAVKGVKVFSVTQAILKNASVWLPSFEEQQKIANFLDHETAKIDTLIAKQEKLIELLKEKRQAVISHAVTKGLNPDAPMKNSGVEWLGEVPEHWRVAGFKRFLSSIVDYRGKTPNKVDSGKFLVTARNIKKGTIDYSLSQEYVSEEEYLSVMSRGLPEVGDVLFTTEAPLGEVAQIDKTDIALAQRIVKFRGEENVLDNTFLKYFIMSSSFQDSLGMFASGSTALGIKAERLVYLRQLIPPLSEQHQIVKHIRNVEDKLNALEVKATDAIELMKERKTALISAAVTGKIDVRDWVGDRK